MTRAGSELVSLLPGRVDWWLTVMEDIMSSQSIQTMVRTFEQHLVATKEMKHTQIDATVKVCMKLKGQGNYRMAAANREAQAMDESEAFYRVMCMRGRTGAVRALEPVRSESAEEVQKFLMMALSQEERSHVETVSTDSASQRLEIVLRSTCPNLQGLILDHMHIAFKYEKAFWNRRSAGARVLRKLLSKFNIFDPSVRASMSLDYFTHDVKLRVSAAEAKARDQVLHVSMPRRAAHSFLEAVDFKRPVTTRLEFVRSVAAFVANFSDEVSRRDTSGEELRQILYNACDPEKVEWKLNSVRRLHRCTEVEQSFLASATTSIEAMHAELENIWNRNQPPVYQSTLQLKLKVFRFSKLWAHHKAMTEITTAALTQDVVISRAVASKTLWHDAEWMTWCQEQDAGARVLPLSAKKARHRALVRAHAAATGRPGQRIRTQSGRPLNFKRVRVLIRKKRTPFNVSRTGAVVFTQGVRGCL